MKKFTNFTILAIWLLAFNSMAQAPYRDGVFMLNEDWFGHNNSSINFLHPKNGQFEYEIIRTQEENMNNGLSLGCTAQYGTIYGGRIYITSKQDQDPGEKGQANGGRLVVADAETMEIIKSFPTIFEINGNSAADGRGFVGVNEDKGYIGTSNGIFVLNLNTLEIGNRIVGSENPLVTGEESNADGLGALYRNQIGMMLRTSDYVLAIQQDKGILVIDPETDEVIEIIEGCFSTMVQSKDGNVWVGRNSNMEYQEYPYGNVGSSGEEWEGNHLLKLNPSTLEHEIIEMPYEVGINQTWYAWTAGSLCASKHRNILYFTFNPDKWSWFTCSKLFIYDIDDDAFINVFDSSSENRYFYGASIRINPLDDMLYGALYVDNVDQSYFIYQFDNEGEPTQVFEPIQRYWFPAMFIFPDLHDPVVSDFEPVSINSGQTINIDLSTMATDADNLDAAITKRIINNSNETGIIANIHNNTLSITGGANPNGTLKIRFNSNGKTVDKIVSISKGESTSIKEVSKNNNISVWASNGQVNVKGFKETVEVEIFNLQGELVKKQQMTDGEVIKGLPNNNIYLIKIGLETFKIIL